MTFEEWCKDHYINNKYSAFNLFRKCWEAATQAERERCIEIVERQTTITLVNQIRTGEDKGE